MRKGLRGFVDDALSRTGPLAVEKSGDFPTARPFAHKLHRALFVSYNILEGQNQPHHRSVDRNWQGSTYQRTFSVQTNGATSIFAARQKRLLEDCGIANEGKAAVVGNIQPLVCIRGYRICTLDSEAQVCEAGRCAGEQPEGSVHMQPCAAWVGITQIGERSKVVEVAGIHLAGVANNDHRPIDLTEQLGQRGNVHRSARCGCLAHLVTTKAECT